MTLTTDRPALSSEWAPHIDRTVSFRQEEISGLEPQTGLGTETDRLIDRQLQCDFDFDFDYPSSLCQRIYTRIRWSICMLGSFALNFMMNFMTSPCSGHHKKIYFLFKYQYSSETINFILFCGLFNDTIGISDYIISSDRVITE
jgi:hypothetical protein